MTRARTISATPRRRHAAALLLLAIGTLAPPRAANALLPQANASGEALYQRECAPCHGPAGHGDGPEAPTFRSPPRDFGDLARADLTPRIIDRVRRSRLRMLEIDEAVVVERRQRMVEELVGYLQHMPDVPWPQVRRGADVYAERCEKCHGPNGRPVTVNALQRGPQATGAQPRPDFQKAHGDAELLAMARGQGHPAVPGFAPVMSEEDAHALLAYLRLLSNGFVWYSLWCAGCHGDEGRGDGLLATGIDQPKVVFDRAWLAAQSPAELRRKAMHLFTDDEPTAPHFARNVSEGQTRAVLAALRALQAAEEPVTPQPAGAARDDRGAPSPARAAGAPPASAAVATPAAVAPAAGADTPAPTNVEQLLRQQGRSTVAPAASPPAARAVVATVAPSATAAGPRSAGPATPAQASAASAAPAAPTPAVTAPPAPSRRPAAPATPRKPAAAQAVKPAPAKPAVKPKPPIKATVKPRPNVKPTPAKKAAPRVTARPTPDHDVEPSRPAPEHVIEVPL